MMIDKALFIGQMITRIELDGETQEWLFDFTNDVNIRVSTPWRIIDDKQILQTSGDEGHIYGLPEAVNVSKNVISMLKGKKILNFNADPVTTDLTFEFEGNLKIQTFADSSGYEPWTMYSKKGFELEYVASGGKIYHKSEIKIIKSDNPESK